MGRGPRYRVAFKRRRKAKTDYRMRRSMILSKAFRLVTRGSIKHIAAQLVEAHSDGDKVLMAAHSKELPKDFDWNAPCGSVPVAYLTGFLFGKRALSLGIQHATPDIGLQKPSAGARVFAVLKGAVDAGLNVPCSKEVLPDESRVRGEHIASYAKQLAETDPVLYEKKFSRYLSKGLKPEKFAEHFDQVKNDIVDAFKRGGKNG